MSEFEFSTLATLLLLLLVLGGYSYWQIYQVQRRQRARADEFLKTSTTTQSEPDRQTQQKYQPSQLLNDSAAHDESDMPLSAPVIEVFPDVLDAVVVPHVESNESSDVLHSEPTHIAQPDVQFFSQQDESEHAALKVFEPIVRFFAWAQSAMPAPIDSIDGVVNIVLSQPKNKTAIEQALYDLRLDTRLPLRLYGRRAGQETAAWQTLEEGALYSGLQLTLQLANAADYARSDLITAWFELVQKFAKRLAATVQAWPDSAALASYAIYLHDLAQHVSAPLVVQLHKSTGLWPAYEVHQYMTQAGANLNEQGQYHARADDGTLLYSVLNDINNPHAQDFVKDMLPTMHVSTLSFCLDLARVAQPYQPSIRLWHDMSQLNQNLVDSIWCNQDGTVLDVPALMAHADVQIGAYYQQLQQLNIPAGSAMLKRLSYR